jgi:ketosteroid isomerase-like protein
MTDNDLENAVLAANGAFYTAFNLRDMKAMAAIWTSQTLAVCAHPGLPPLYGRDQVLESLRGALGNPAAPRIKVEQARAIVLGQSAMVICEEHIGTAVLIATNVFILEGGVWRIVHHHAGMRAGSARPADPPAQDKRILH